MIAVSRAPSTTGRKRSKAFGQTIADFQNTQFKLAELHAATVVSRAFVDRCIEQYSMPGETVLDPFGGLMTVPYCAVKLKRRGYGIELSPAYYLDGAAYCAAAEREMSMPDLFDTLNEQEKAA